MKINEIITEVSQDLRNRYVTRASDDYGHANFGARMSKDHPGLEDYHQKQTKRAEKRAKGLNRALSDKRSGREVSESEEAKLVEPTIVNGVRTYGSEANPITKQEYEKSALMDILGEVIHTAYFTAPLGKWQYRRTPKGTAYGVETTKGKRLLAGSKTDGSFIGDYRDVSTNTGISETITGGVHTIMCDFKDPKTGSRVKFQLKKYGNDEPRFTAVSGTGKRDLDGNSGGKTLLGKPNPSFNKLEKMAKHQLVELGVLSPGQEIKYGELNWEPNP